MSRLANRQMQIPGGFKFMQPEINWRARPGSFHGIVQQIIRARSSNVHYLKKHGWSVDPAVVADELDAYNAKICVANGWDKYVIGGAVGGLPPPLPKPRSPEQEKLLGVAAAKAKKIWTGVKTLNDWLDSGEPPVSKALSEARSATCVACPLNGKGDFTAFFTVPAAASIKRQIERMQERSISGSLDDKLGVCEACLCPLVIKTKTPMKFIKPYLSGEMIDELRKGKDCWVLKE